jgi:hypothetical protein
MRRKNGDGTTQRLPVAKVQPYNPLDKLNLAKSIETELVARNPAPLNGLQNVQGAGVYAIYYSGSFAPYEIVASTSTPIYVGKAIPKGGRKGGLISDASASGRALADRLRNHAQSIKETDNLDPSDFSVRYLIVEDIWIPLGENALIETFKPVWNIALDGFGNKTPGRRRMTQYKSPWDIVHPGREFANLLADPPAPREFFLQRIADYFSGKPLAKLPKELARQEAELDVEALDAADEA